MSDLKLIYLCCWYKRIAAEIVYILDVIHIVLLVESRSSYSILHFGSSTALLLSASHCKYPTHAREARLRSKKPQRSQRDGRFSLADVLVKHTSVKNTN